MPANGSDWEKKLQIFFDDNPTAKLGERKGTATDSRTCFCIESPWNDTSLRLNLDVEVDAVAEALNSVVLMERLSAIWHKDTKDLEVIFTAFPIPKPIRDLSDRSFVFRFGSTTYECEFAGSSERLKLISKSFEALQSSQTDFRNLQSYHSYFLFLEESRMQEFAATCKPISFWIHNIENQSDDIISTIAHLNFFMSYYDRRTPTITIHPPKLKRSDIPEDRFPANVFPKNITGRMLDDNLLHYWEAASQGDPARRFLYYYRIIEYAASLYVDQGNRAAMKRALSAPNALDDIERISDEIMTISARIKMDEYQRMEAMLKEFVDVKRLWHPIERNKSYFSTEQNFQGGFALAPIASQKMTIDEFAPNAFLVFVRHIKDIRNALSHGKDQKTQSVIVPTVHNLRQLSPWVSLIATAAGDLILYRS